MSRKTIAPQGVAGHVYPFGYPTDVHFGDVQAKLDDLVFVDPTDGGLVVYLPGFEPGDQGRAVTVCNVSASANTVTFAAVDGTVNGSATVARGAARFVSVVVAVNASQGAWQVFGEV